MDFRPEWMKKEEAAANLRRAQVELSKLQEQEKRVRAHKARLEKRIKGVQNDGIRMHIDDKFVPYDAEVGRVCEGVAAKVAEVASLQEAYDAFD